MSDASGVTAFLHFYKVYHLDKFEKIKQSALVMAADDADALRKAGALASDHDVEVWDRSRHVGTIEAGSRFSIPALSAQTLSQTTVGAVAALNAA